MKKIISGSIMPAAAFLLLIVQPVICFAGYVNESGFNNSVSTAQLLDPFFSYGVDPMIEIDAAGNPADYSVSVMGLGFDNTYDYYSFSVGTGGNDLALNTWVVFDIDLAQVTGLDSFLTLYGTDGTTVLASNNNSLFNGPGDFLPVTTNSFFSHAFDTAGLYYIQVGQNNGGSSAPISAFSSYRLNISSVPVPSSLFLMFFGVLGFLGFKRKTRV
ncbi:MAG: DVUA0089 family protein [Proteobacteria bacterium]|nr:DVUA0089 family protein [Pseudomonadota bacterium]MBU1388536.1 DVUA0089 family protein [Pseudomonadota bacterium]MBU1544833.1 DVUA0089 family protein [Pseudomonadota bacterium]MBU2431389.1 DVUA0089 family protein [Pseudomonadota bacterium]MBU2482688.1 DVUA0089 family protein [Pseudomonadota bacterium]